MKLTDKENFVISLPQGAYSEMEDFNKGVADFYSEGVDSADISDQNREVLSLRLSGGKIINVTANDAISRQFLNDSLKYIMKNMIGKSLGDVLEYDYGNADRILNK